MYATLTILQSSESQFKSCCGKVICYGCMYEIAMELKQRGKTEEDDDLCPYCRLTPYSSDEELLKCLKLLMENGNSGAFNILASCYANGSKGMPRDMAKANELYQKAGELGNAD